MASLTSESDSITFADEETQYHISFYSFSLTMDMNRVSRNPRVPVAQEVVNYEAVGDWEYGVRVHYFLLLSFCQITLCL